MAAATLATWAISILPQVRRVLYPIERVRVVAANSLESIVIANEGDYEIYVSHALMAMTGRPEWQARHIPIQRTLPAGQFLRQGINGSTLKTADFVKGDTTAHFDTVLAKALKEPNCYEPVFLAVDDPFLKKVDAMTQGSVNKLQLPHITFRHRKGECV